MPPTMTCWKSLYRAYDSTTASSVCSAWSGAPPSVVSCLLGGRLHQDPSAAVAPLVWISAVFGDFGWHEAEGPSFRTNNFGEEARPVAVPG